MLDKLDIIGTGTVPMRGPYSDIRAMIAANRAAGGHYFSSGAIRFFQARQHDCVSGRLLVESVKNGGAPRRYRVRALIDGQVHTPNGGDGAHGAGFATLYAARAFAFGIAGNMAHDSELIGRLRDEVATYLVGEFPGNESYGHGALVTILDCRVEVGECYAEIHRRYQRLGGVRGSYTIRLDDPTHADIADAVRTLDSGATAAATAIGASA